MRVVPFLVALLAPAIATAQTTICVDAGHGGADPGAVGCGFEEEDIVVDTVLRLRDLLTQGGYRAVLTRENDTAVSLAARSNLANSEGAARFMSIHANSAASVATGIETFCSNNASGNAVDLRDQIQSEMIGTWPLRDRGGKRANFSVLVNTNMPATLTELGFINNCSVDVRYLTDPNERQRAAQAHFDALTRHLGGTPMPTTGTLTGVVFEDKGQGLADTSIRIEGATVTVQETNATVNSAATTGAWEFALPAGNYTVVAERDGYTLTARTCTVVVGDVTWCSIGLFTTAPTPDAGVEVDAGPPPPADAGLVRDAGTGRDGGAPATDATVDSGVAEPDKNATEAEDEGCACTLHPVDDAHRRPSLGLLLLAVLLFRRRWRGCAMAAVVLWAVFTPSSAGAHPTLKIVETTVVAEDLHRPRVAPDGDNIIATNPSMDRVVRIDLRDRTKTVLVERPRSGYLPVWSRDGRAFGVRNPRRPYGGDDLMQYDLLGTYRGPQSPRLDMSQTNDGVNVNGRRVDRGTTKAFAPIADPTGRFVAYETTTEGLYVYRVADGQTFALGRGSSPAFSADGRLLVFERTADDGHTIRSSGIYVARLTDTPKAEPLFDEASVERFPSLSGRHAGHYVLAFERDGKIIIQKILDSSEDD